MYISQWLLLLINRFILIMLIQVSCIVAGGGGVNKSINQYNFIYAYS